MKNLSQQLDRDLKHLKKQEDGYFWRDPYQCQCVAEGVSHLPCEKTLGRWDGYYGVCGKAPPPEAVDVAESILKSLIEQDIIYDFDLSLDFYGEVTIEITDKHDLNMSVLIKFNTIHTPFGMGGNEHIEANIFGFTSSKFDQEFSLGSWRNMTEDKQAALNAEISSMIVTGLKSYKRG